LGVLGGCKRAEYVQTQAFLLPNKGGTFPEVGQIGDEENIGSRNGNLSR
jgi:hypothetical protein